MSEKESKKLKMFPCPICRTYGSTALRGCKVIVTNLREVIEGSKNMESYKFLYRGPYELEISDEPLKILVICDDTFKCNIFVILLGTSFYRVPLI